MAISILWPHLCSSREICSYFKLPTMATSLQWSVTLPVGWLMLRGSTVTQIIAFWFRTEKVVGICSFLGLPPNKVVPRLKQKVMSFKQGMPVITSLRNAALRTRHWEAIQNVIGTRIVRDKYFTLGHLLQLKVINNCKPR